MGDISFLSDKSDNSKKDVPDASSVKWSVPTGSEKNDFLSGADAGNKGGGSGFFSFGKKEARTASKEQLEAERAEVINALDPNAEKPSFFSFLKKKKKKGLDVDFEADFKEDLKQRDTKIDRALGQASLPSSTSFSVPIDPPIEKARVVAAGTDDIASYRTTLFDRLIDKWRKKKTVEETGTDEIPEEKIDTQSPDLLASAGDKPEGEQAVMPEATVKKMEKPVVEKKKDDKVLRDSDVLETNLMEGESISFFDWQKNMTTLGVFAAMAAIIVGMAYAGLVIYGEEKSKSAIAIDNEIIDLNYKIGAMQESTKEFAPLENKIKLVSSLLAQHIYWTNFFDFLENYTIADVYYGSFSGDSKGKYTLSARAKNFNNLTEQLKIFRDADEYVSQVNISGGKLTTSETDRSSGVDFSLDITLRQDIFNK